MKIFQKKQQTTEPTPTKKVWQLESGHVVHDAFVSGGIQHYYIKEAGDTFSHRALNALPIFDSFASRCDRDFIAAHKDKGIKILKTPCAIELNALTEQRNQLLQLFTDIEDRLNWALPVEETIWKFAGVVFFDEKESPYVYDPVYAEEKIARWKKDADLPFFLFSAPLKTFIPLPQDISTEDLNIFLKTIKDMNEVHLSRLLSDVGLGRQNNNSSLDVNSQKNSASSLTDVPLSSTSS